MAHGEEDNYLKYLKGEHQHVQKRVHTNFEDDPFEFCKESFTAHDFEHGSLIFTLLNRLKYTVSLSILASAPWWFFGLQNRSPFALRMIEAKHKGNIYQAMKYQFFLAKPFLAAGVASGFIVTALYDNTSFEEHTRLLLAAGASGIATGMVTKKKPFGPLGFMLLFMGMASFRWEINNWRKYDRYNMRIADKDRTEEEGRKARLNNLVYNLSYYQTEKLRSQFYEKI